MRALDFTKIKAKGNSKNKKIMRALNFVTVKQILEKRLRLTQ